MNSRFGTLLKGVIAFVPLLMFAGSANAILTVTIDFDLSTPAVFDAIYTDGDGDGAIAETFNLAGTQISIIAGSGAPDVGYLTDLQFQSTIAAGAKGVIRVFDDTYSLGIGNALVTSSVSPTIVGGAATSIQTFVNGGLILSSGALVTGVDMSSTVNVALLDPSTFMHVISIDNTGLTASSLTTFDTVTQVPEPSVLALLGVGLLGAGYARRRKQREIL